MQTTQTKPNALWFYNKPPTSKQILTSSQLGLVIKVDETIYDLFEFPISSVDDRNAVLLKLAKAAQFHKIGGFCGVFSPIWQELIFQSTFVVAQKGYVQLPKNGVGDFFCISPFHYDEHNIHWCVVGYITIDKLLLISNEFRN